MICYYPAGIYNNNINSVGDTAVEQLVKLDTNGRGCGDLYRRPSRWQDPEPGGRSIHRPMTHRNSLSSIAVFFLSLTPANYQWLGSSRWNKNAISAVSLPTSSITSRANNQEARLRLSQLFNTVGREEVMGRFQSLNDKADDLFDMVVARRPGMSSYFTPICPPERE